MKTLGSYTLKSKQLQEELSLLSCHQNNLIFILRHGQIEDHETKRFIGQTDVYLDKIGIAQALFWQKTFLNAGIQFDAVYSSSLKRSVKTAKIIFPERDFAVVKESESIFENGVSNYIWVDRRLDEINMGNWDGRTFADIKKTMPVEFEERGKKLNDFRPPNGENFKDLSERIKLFFDDLSRQLSSQVFFESTSSNHFSDGFQKSTTVKRQILVVTHAGIIRVLLSRLMNMDITDTFKTKLSYGHLFVFSMS
jgi:alpha-ribazole phosphatase